MAARTGLGVLGFSVGSIDELAPVMEAYKKEITKAEPVGAYTNNNIMVTSGAYIAEDRETAYDWATAPHNTYLASNVYRYHDTFPHPPTVPHWPKLLPDATRDAIPLLVQGGGVIGDPDDALKQCRRWEAAGADQLVFGLGTATQEQSLEMIRLMGEHVIPKVDIDPVHRTTRHREGAAAGA
jgi:alkanesulfonate monooxygenase SsuD/methylene tetrahydromethanopterin reductase-like flavin-dependent oxidoreductase (luciferase family)